MAGTSPSGKWHRYHNAASNPKALMQITAPTERLTDAALLAMLQAAVAPAQSMGQPQCIVIVDPSAVELALIRMAAAKVLSMRSAQTAASTGKPSTALPAAVRAAIAAATARP
jgi:glc operon protein GlcG